VEQFSLIECFLNFVWYTAVFIFEVIKCTKIILSGKVLVFSSIVVTIANAKNCV